MKKISAVISLSKIEDLFAFIATLVITGLFLLITVDALGRYLFARPITDGHQISEALLVVFVYLAIALTQREKRHISIDLLAGKFSTRNKIIVEIYWRVIQLFAVGFILYGSSIHVVGSFLDGEVLRGITRIPAAPFRLFVVIGSAVLCIRIVVQLVASVAHLCKSK